MAEKRIPLMKSVMTAFPHSLDVNASLRQARDMMLEHDIRHVPVKDGNKLVGVITDRDLRRALDPGLAPPPKDELVVEDVMVRNLFVVDLNERLDDVLLELADEDNGCVIVVKGGRLAGIFTATDACRVFGEHLRSEFPPTRDDDVA